MLLRRIIFSGGKSIVAGEGGGPYVAERDLLLLRENVYFCRLLEGLLILADGISIVTVGGLLLLW